MPIVTEAPKPPKPKRIQVPGDFHRHERDGRPRVTHPTELIADGSRGKFVYYGRPSGIAKDLESAFALTKWRERRLMFGAGDPHVARMIEDLSQLEYDSAEWKRQADKATVAAAKAGRATEDAERGTHTHELTEDDDLPDPDDREERDIIARIEAGEELGIPRHVQLALLDAWRQMLADYGIEILAVELTVVHDGYEHAGTLDRIGLLTRDITFEWRGGTMTLPAGTVIVLDLKAGRIRFGKSGEILHWRTYVCQVATYAGSVIYDTLTDTRHPFPWPVDQDWAIIAHLPVAEAMEGTAVCRLVLVDIAEGRRAIEQMVLPMTKWQKRTDLLGLAHPDEPRIEIDVNKDRSAVVSEMTRQSLQVTQGERRVVLAMDSTADTFDGLDGSTPWADRLGSPAMRRFLATRIKNLSEHPDALAAFVAQMDALGVPRLSKCETHTNRQLRQIEAELVRVECRFGVACYTVTTPPLDRPPNEGRDLTPDETRELAATYKAVDQKLRVAVDVWATEARQAGLDVHMSTSQTERRRANLLARIACADPELEPDFVRAAIAHVTREDWPHMPSIPLGACFGALTIDEATRLIEMAPSLVDAAYSFDKTGALQLVA